MSEVTAPGIHAFSELYYPERNFIKSIPAPLAVTAGVMSGIVKTLLFPLFSAISTIGFLFKGIYEATLGDAKKAGPTFEACLISLSGFLVSAAFFVLAAYTMPIIGSSAVVLAAMTISVSIHVYRACERDTIKE